MKWIYLLLGVYSLIIAHSVTAETQSITGYACEDCSAKEAAKLTSSQASVLLSCQPDNNQNTLKAASSNCVLTQRRFLIFDIFNQKAHAFNLAYQRQRLATTPSRLTKAEHSAAKDFFQLLQVKSHILDNIALSHHEDISLPNSQIDFKANSCSLDPGAVVLRLALDPTLTTRLRDRVNVDYNSLSADDERTGFAALHVSESGFYALRNGSNFSVAWDKLHKARLIKKQIIAESADYATIAHTTASGLLAFRLGWQDDLTALSVEVEPQYTMITPDISLADVLHHSSWNIKLSACAIAELQQHFVTSSYARPRSDFSAEKRQHHSNTTEIAPEHYSADAVTDETCRWLFHDKEGKLVSTVSGPCPS
ncbi:hypothetical protein AGRI_11392 [Alishewanella agri BL06]|uniref:Uncharacterized protein n=1 Tax=Alishewanella agri BL06 TaxID=1195246 RepID=I8U8T7_9ALTE|nr:hypothetical protein [Alishewanella agri]EIW88403.1 hypothetical protein AGRI_11392 [Alishewanella agri BL06]